MAETTSWAFPNIFNITNNQVNIIEDTYSIANRTRLMILTDPTELYNNPEFGVGLKRYLWQYNNDAVRGVIKDRITEQLRLNEPCVYPEKTKYSDGLLFSDPTGSSAGNYNTLALTVSLATVYKDEVEVSLNYDSEKGTLTTKHGDDVVSVTKVQ